MNPWPSSATSDVEEGKVVLPRASLTTEAPKVGKLTHLQGESRLGGLKKGVGPGSAP